MMFIVVAHICAKQKALAILAQMRYNFRREEMRKLELGMLLSYQSRGETKNFGLKFFRGTTVALGIATAAILIIK